MSKLFSILFCMLLCYQVVYAVLERLEPQEKPAEYDGQDGCYVPSIEKFLKFGEVIAPQDGQCKRYQCFDNGDTAIASCDIGQNDVDAGRATPGDCTKGYPDCCAQSTQ